MRYEEAWGLYEINELGDTVNTQIINIERNEGYIHLTILDDSDEEHFIYLEINDFNSLFGDYLINGELTSLINRNFQIDFDIYFENDNGEECSDPCGEVNWVKEIFVKSC